MASIAIPRCVQEAAVRLGNIAAPRQGGHTRSASPELRADGMTDRPQPDSDLSPRPLPSARATTAASLIYPSPSVRRRRSRSKSGAPLLWDQRTQPHRPLGWAKTCAAWSAQSSYSSSASGVVSRPPPTHRLLRTAKPHCPRCTRESSCRTCHRPVRGPAKLPNILCFPDDPQKTARTRAVHEHTARGRYWSGMANSITMAVKNGGETHQPSHRVNRRSPQELQRSPASYRLQCDRWSTPRPCGRRSEEIRWIRRTVSRETRYA